MCFPERLLGERRRIAVKYDIWRVTLGRDPPALVFALSFQSRKDAKPSRDRPRVYAPRLREFMKKFCEELYNFGWVRENKQT